MRKLVVLLAVLLAVGTACSDDAEVGEGVETEGLDGSGERLGAVTTTTAPPTTVAPATTAPPRAAPTTAPSRPTAPPTTRAAQQAAIEIKIQGDTQGSQFDPRLAQVRSGSVVKWVNVDSEPRSVAADNGAFRSPLIAPGASFELKAPAPGQYNYHDGTRPYAVAQLQVV